MTFTLNNMRRKRPFDGIQSYCRPRNWFVRGFKPRCSACLQETEGNSCNSAHRLFLETGINMLDKQVVYIPDFVDDTHHIESNPVKNP
ncbi:hypothetical protein CDAR_546561 [Caerostris darwini]|uniref:Uncharacterized protein n=1 Tax=Caerostris darwini TaxID=1538125 RepID=A0AAV4TQ19_9ARAC|nr:hypothetical protein CDAR_546561 [Caerostris darwini]